MVLLFIICFLLLLTIEFVDISVDKCITISGMHFKGHFLCVFITQKDKVGKSQVEEDEDKDQISVLRKPNGKYEDVWFLFAT